MMKLFAAACAAILLAGCSTIQNVQQAAETVSPQAAYVVANLFDGVERTAANYINYCADNKWPKPQCSKRAAHQLVPLMKSGRAVRDTIEALPDQTGYDKLKGVIAAAQSIFVTYHIGEKP